MAKKKQQAAAGAPAWMTTYGDMITLILCFFVLLFSMSVIREDKITKTMRAFQKQFSVLPKWKSTVQVFIESRRLTQTEANVLRQGPPGKSLNVQVIDPGKRMKIVLGGKSLFREWEHTLTPEGQRLIREKLAPDLRGFENKIAVRGHTASARYGAGAQFRDSWDLSYRRARSVMRFLVDECGIDEQRFRLVACGDTEPIRSNRLPDAREENRRVEVVMTEELVSDRAARIAP
jgi:chemotaxis protein MotB